MSNNIKGIYLGISANDALAKLSINLNDLKKWAKENDIALYQMNLDDNYYRLIPKPIID